ncbi:hypothetical protein [Rhizobium leguminosarum]|uniref:hypothetical protein n=1 Tax=Rhizobium leguminosarum TaxID=384 RepID=UPI001C989611|nr:hypothetical protein [Rhizobium leguminosarum]MBY5351308.1 hypothetical protein [Rhizobium leguminosarum]
MSVAKPSPALGSTIDARPTLVRNPESAWGRAVAERDRIFDAMCRLAQEWLPGAAVTPSNPGIYPAVVKVEHWFRFGSASERISMRVTVEPKPLRCHPIEYAVEVTDRSNHTRHYQLSELTEDDLLRALQTLARPDGKLVWRRRLRTMPFQFWLPGNRITVARYDLVKYLLYAVGLLLAAIVLFGAIGFAFFEIVDRIREALSSTVYGLFNVNYYDDTTTIDIVFPAIAVGAAYWVRSRWPATLRARLSIVVAALFLFLFQPTGWILGMWYALGSQSEGSPNSTPLVLGLLAAFAALFFWDRQRQTIIYNEGRPLNDPRTLLIADYWHSVLDKLGDSDKDVTERFLSLFVVLPHPMISIGKESYFTVGPDGNEARDHITLTFRRAIIYCQIQAYSGELYVGWDAYLNIGRWKEVEIARGMQSLKGVLSVRTVEPDYASVNEYDLHDLNCLIEWTHSRLTEVVRAVAAEKDLDQQLDFKIQRAERQTLLKERTKDAPRWSIMRRS